MSVRELVGTPADFFPFLSTSAARFLLCAKRQLLHDNPAGAAPRAVGAMKRAAAAPVLRSDALRELILVGLAQINTARPCSRSCGPLPGWPPPSCDSSTHRARERKQASERERETAMPSQSLQRLGGPNAAYYQSRVFPTPAGPLVCSQRHAWLARKRWANSSTVILPPWPLAVFFLLFPLLRQTTEEVLFSKFMCKDEQLSNPKRPSGMPSAFLLFTSHSLSRNGWECESGVWQPSKLD